MSITQARTCKIFRNTPTKYANKQQTTGRLRRSFLVWFLGLFFDPSFDTEGATSNNRVLTVTAVRTSNLTHKDLIYIFFFFVPLLTTLSQVQTFSPGLYFHFVLINHLLVKAKHRISQTYKTTS